MAPCVSRSGSTETKKALTLPASLPRARSTSEISNNEVGQTSGQWVKPKKIRLGRPFRFFSVTGWPDWSASWNGPPIAAGVATFLKSPISQVIRSSPTARLKAKAAMMTTGRLSRCMGLTSSEAGGDAGSDHLEKHRRAVINPERGRSCDGQGAESGGAPDNHGRHPRFGRGCGHHSVLGWDRPGHGLQIGRVIGAGKRGVDAANHVMRRDI